MKETLEVQLDDEEPESRHGQITRESIQKFIFKNRWVVVSGFIGLIFVGLGVFFLRAGVFEGTEIEVLEATGSGGLASSEVIVEISGAVEKPGVYKLLASERLERLLIEAGGLAADADREWAEKNLNRAAKLLDGQKIYIPKEGENIKSTTGTTSTTGIKNNQPGSINLNTASAGELDSLPGIGAVRARAIIDSRPYSSPQELLNRKIIPQSVYEKIKERISAP